MGRRPSWGEKVVLSYVKCHKTEVKVAQRWTTFYP